ncbi:helix-turn-helix transcriptional regulator [Streptomyces sp. NPDC026672]|uniref:helix-turn-helix domain-containing protein n=1 Tax=unclassified Streptomyces TaxID=2593676 RepID=UPI0033E79508
MTNRAPDRAPVVPPRPRTPGARIPAPGATGPGAPPAAREEPLLRNLVGDVLRRERTAQERTLRDVADAARISLPYLSEIERGRKEASSEVLAAAARALGLGLGDLLSRTGAELTRRTTSGRAASPYEGLCLAA